MRVMKFIASLCVSDPRKPQSYKRWRQMLVYQKLPGLQRPCSGLRTSAEIKGPGRRADLTSSQTERRAKKEARRKKS